MHRQLNSFITLNYWRLVLNPQVSKTANAEKLVVVCVWAKGHRFCVLRGPCRALVEHDVAVPFLVPRKIATILEREQK